DQQTGAKYGMVTLDMGMLDWYRKGRIAREEVINRCLDPQGILAKIAEVDAEIEAEVADDDDD
ncbi:MAG: type IV pili twitching motility protein PilT, partial [Verrucomicrobiia bacterium]